VPTTSSASTAVTRSGFVTGLAWVFIVLAGIATLIAILQNIMLALMFPTEELRAAVKESENTQPMPALFRFMFENFRYFFAGFLALSAGTLIAAIGLLKRRNWARLIFIAIMALGVVWNLASLAIPFMMTSLIPEVPAHAQSDFHDNFKVMWNIMIGFTVVIGLAFAALFVWIIKRLVSNDIKREFLAL
jgi:hypothetical protein